MTDVISPELQQKADAYRACIDACVADARAAGPGTANRLDAEHHATVRRQFAATVKMWDDASTRGPATIGPVEVDTLVRVGAHALGLGVADLRPVERDWIRAEAEKLRF